MAVEELTVRLNDEVTQAARRAANSVANLSAKMAAAKRGSGRVASDSASAVTKASRAELQALEIAWKARRRMRDNESAYIRAQQKKDRGLRTGNTIVRREQGGVGGMLNSFVGNVGANMASMAAGAASAAARAAVSSIAFRENSLRGLTFLLGSGKAAQAAYSDAAKLSGKLGQSTQETVTMMQTFLAQGMSKGAAEQLIVSMAALKQVNPAANLEGITRAMMQISATGKLQGDELMQLAEAGLSVDDVYKNLEKTLGKTRDEILKMQAEGKISSKDAIAAINASISARVGGDPFKIATQGGRSLSGVLTRVSNLWEDMWANASVDTSGVQSLADALDNIDSERLGKAAGNLTNLTTGAAGKAVSMLAKDITTLSNALSWLNAQLGVTGGKIDELTAKMMVIEGVGALIGAVLETAILGPFNFVLVKALEVVNGIRALVADGSSIGAQIGKAIAMGIADGITFGGASALAATISLVQRVKGAANGPKGADSHSPSRLFADEVGAQMSAGMAVGISSNAERVRAAAASVATNAVPANTNGRAGGGSAGGVSVGSVTVMVNMGGGGGSGGASGGGQASGQAIGQDAAKAFWAEVRKLAEAG